MKTWRYYIVAFVVILALGVVPWAIATAYMNETAEGTVIAKREAFVMPGGDSWEHVFEITYRFRTPDSPYPETAAHKVAPALYRRLQIGSTVRVRYSPLRLLRSMVGVGSFLADSSWLSRVGYESGDVHEFAELGGIGVAVLMAVAAYKRKSKLLGVAAAVIGGVCVPVFLLAVTGFFLFPILFWAWRGHPGKGYGWALLGTMALSTAAVYWRIPRPTPMPPGPRREATAIVRRARVVNEIWSNVREGSSSGSEGGQDIRRPFQMADLEFTPEGATEPIHVLDRVDLDSVPGLREGARVQIYYSSADARLARIAGGTRNYAQQALIYLLGFAYGIGAALAFVVFPAIHIVKKLVRSSSIFGPLISHYQTMQQLSSLPADDPRRKAWDAFMRTRRHS
jgi:hypothetical protein